MAAAAPLPPHLVIAPFEALGVHAFVTTREAGSYGLPEVGEDPEATARWSALQRALAERGAPRLASARQVHGTRILQHSGDWEGWRRIEDADGHLMLVPGAAAITIADCVPVFLAHPSGRVGLVHAGWRGVAGGILGEAVQAFADRGMAPADLVVHFGPAVCGRCYEVGADVYRQLTGWETKRPRQVDLRALLADQAKALGVVRWSASGECTRCENGLLFSHRAGDGGRQVACIVAPPA